MTSPHMASAQTDQMPTDQEARDRIRTDLVTNMLVEAGAGSGKTTALVGRLLEHVRTGTPVDRLTAVTFTRKAAAELRERFQVALEHAVRAPETDAAERLRYDGALHELDRAFLGTIHAFCARLLRERPLEIGLDPNFQEISDEDAWNELQRSFWRRWVERAVAASDPDLRALLAVGIDPRQLFTGFACVVQFLDVDFPTGDATLPDITPCRRELERLLTEARRLMPREEPEDGWDELMRLVRRLDFLRGVKDWSGVNAACVTAFCDALGEMTATRCKATQGRWSDTREGKAEAKALGESFATFLDGPVAELLHCWRAHRYPIVMRVLRRAADDFACERHATGQLGFEDLLLLAVRLVREHPAVRDELGARYPYLLVDEFQDTDPVQAELCFLLASDAATGSDWRTLTPRPGSLFVVGDPKQSIYRFRRADIQVYEFVKRRMTEVGAVLALTRNFRSVTSIATVVNGHFATVFPADATPEQAPYRPMEAAHVPAGADGVYRYVVQVDGRGVKSVILERDAAMVASWIADRIAHGERTAGDFLILTAGKGVIGWYARALSERNVPVSTTGAMLPQEHELRELLVVLHAIADPENAINIAAALEGVFFGLSPADLWDATQQGIHLSLTRPPAVEVHEVHMVAHPVGQALQQLHAWWTLSQRHPADVLLERILDDTGLLFHAASQPLGDARAGALLHLVEALRSASVQGANGITDAMERLELLLTAEAPDAPLRPGRTDTVRVMNLHKAKGLEGKVVILAAPVDETAKDVLVHVTRGGDGVATGGLCIGYQAGNRDVVLAHPSDWREMEEAERKFSAAERERLLYVAATRARRELVVAQAEKVQKTGNKPDSSLWRPFAPVLEQGATLIALPERTATGQRAMERPVTALHDAVASARARVERAQEPSFVVRTVTEEVKGDPGPQPEEPAPAVAGSGVAWGRAVHRSIEAFGRGRRGETLHAFIRAVARDERLSDEQTGVLQQIVDQVATSDVWRDLLATGVPLMELSVMQHVTGTGAATITEGVIDTVVLGDDGWRLLDWKSDTVAAGAWDRRHERYQRQVTRYATMLAMLTDQPAKGSVHRLS